MNHRSRRSSATEKVSLAKGSARNGVRSDTPKQDDLKAWELLERAVIIGDLDLLRRLAKENFNFAIRNPHTGETALHRAAQEATLLARGDNLLNRVMRFLVEHGVDINATNTAGETPLFHLVRFGKKKHIEEALRLGANPNVVNKRGWTPLTVYLSEKKKPDVEVLRILLENGADPNLRGKKGTPLFLCIENIFPIEPSLVEALLNAGADPALCTGPEDDPLIALTIFRQDFFLLGPKRYLSDLTYRISLAEHFVKKGADPLREDKTGMRLLSRLPILMLSEQTYGPTFLDGLRKLIQTVLEAGDDINRPDSNGDYPIHNAAKNSLALRVYLELGADPGARASDGWTPAHVVVKYGKWADIFLLLEKGADVYALDSDGESPIGELFRSRPFELNLETIKALTDGGIDLRKVREGDGKTLLHILAKELAESPYRRWKHKERTLSLVFKELVRIGISPNETDSQGNTFLHYLAGADSFYLVKVAISWGADPTVLNKEERSPGDILAETKKRRGGVFPPWAVSLGLFPAKDKELLVDILSKEASTFTLIKAEKFLKGILKNNPVFFTLELAPYLAARSEIFARLVQRVLGPQKGGELYVDLSF